MTRFDRILSRLLREGRSTVHELSMCGGGNNPHARISENTDALGNIRKMPGRRIVKEYTLHEGRTMTVFKLVNA